MLKVNKTWYSQDRMNRSLEFPEDPALPRAEAATSLLLKDRGTLWGLRHHCCTKRALSFHLLLVLFNYKLRLACSIMNFVCWVVVIINPTFDFLKGKVKICGQISSITNNP